MTQEDEDIPETGAVFTFGKSRFADNTPNKFWIRSDRVTAVACGDDHSAFVTDNGRLYTFGANEWGQLGLGSSKSSTKPSSVKALKQEGVHSVACGRLHTLALSKAGRLYTFGAGGEGQLGRGDLEGSEVPKLVQSLAGQTVVQMSCGTDHSFILTDAGVLFSWGGGGEGQLGLGDTLECAMPRELDISYTVTQVSCGYYHTAFITDGGLLYTFGENDLGKLGLGEDYSGNTNGPTHVTSIESPVHSVSCGNNHTAAIAGDKDLYTFGEGNQGQLGLGPSVLQTSTPRLVTKFRKHRCRSVCCGESHTAVSTESGSLYTFGDGRHGKLGQGEESFSNLFIPTRVRRFKGFYVEQVSCGGCHTLVRARRQVPDRDPDSSESESEQEMGEEGMDMSRLGDNLKKIADSMDLNGSLGGTARGRRRQREISPLPPLARTLPPLGSSTPVTKTKAHDTFAHQMIPTIPSSADKHSKTEVPSNSTLSPSKRVEESEDSSYEESEGLDEVDAGTPPDEDLDRTYFSRSGNRSDMKRMGSMKRKSKNDGTDNDRIGGGEQTNGLHQEGTTVGDHSDGDSGDNQCDEEDESEDDDPGFFHRAARQDMKNSKEVDPQKDKNPAAASVEKPRQDDAVTERSDKSPAVPNEEKAAAVDDDSDDDDDESDDDEEEETEDDDDIDDDEAAADNSDSDNESNVDDNGNKSKTDVGSSSKDTVGEDKGDLKHENEKGGVPSGGTQGQGDGGSKVGGEEMAMQKTSAGSAENDKKSWQFWKKKPATALDEGSSTDPPDTLRHDPKASPTKVTENAAATTGQTVTPVDASKSSKACVIL